MRQFSPKRIAADEIHQEELDLFLNGIRLEDDGIRLPPYLEKEKGSVNVASDELAKVLFQFSYVLGIMASDAFVEKRVAKHLIKAGQIDRFESVTEYFGTGGSERPSLIAFCTLAIASFSRFFSSYPADDTMKDLILAINLWLARMSSSFLWVGYIEIK